MYYENGQDHTNLSLEIADETKRKRILQLTCCLVPKSHRDCMEILFAFLNWTASFSQVDEESGSKMDTHNLATVIAPNILYADPKTGAPDESFLAIEAINMLLEYNDSMCKVPEDIQSVLNDTDLFSSMPEVTTKEILKRYGEIAKRPAELHGTAAAGLQTQQQSSSPEQFTAPTRAGVKRVDTDPDQLQAWQQESSVRHVAQSSNGMQMPSYPQINQSTPPQLQNEFHNHHLHHHQNRNSPYQQQQHHYRTGSGDSLRSNGGTPSSKHNNNHRPSNFSRGPPTGQQQQAQQQQSLTGDANWEHG